MNKGANGVVTFECADKDSGPKLLSMKGDNPSPAPSAPSATAAVSTPAKDNSKSSSTASATPAPSTSSQKTTSKTDSSDKTKTSKADEPSSSGVVMGSVGSQFVIHDKGGGLYTIEVVGVDKSSKYVDGSKNDGTVGLGAAGNKGTTWKKETDSSGNVRFKCADCTGSKVYLDGQQSDGAWMVGLGIKGNTGTEWKMVPQPDGRYSLECVDKKSGPQFLSMVTNGKTVAPSVPYNPKPVTAPNTGTTPKPPDNKKAGAPSNSNDKKKADPLQNGALPSKATITHKDEPPSKVPEKSGVKANLSSDQTGNVAKAPGKSKTVDTKDETGPNEALMAFWGGIGSTVSALSKLPGMEQIENLGKAWDLGSKIPSRLDFLKAAFEAKNAPNEGEQTLKAANALLSFLKIIGDGIAGGTGAIDNLQKQMNKTLTPEFVKVQDLKKQIIGGDWSKLEEYEQAQQKLAEQQSQAHLQGN